VLAVIVVVFSLFTFISSAISDSIKTDIDLANSKTIILLTHLSDPDGTLPDKPKPFVGSTTYSLQDLLIDLQQFATSLRSIDSRARQLHRLVQWLPVNATDPFEQTDLSKDAANSLQGELEAKTSPEANFARLLPIYQQVRIRAKSAGCSYVLEWRCSHKYSSSIICDIGGMCSIVAQNAGRNTR